MFELEIQKRLRDSTSLYAIEEALKGLENEYHITAKAHKDYPNLYSLKYDMLESPMNEEIVQECRGLILNSTDNWNVIAYPFKKFFNQGEQLAAKIDWGSAKVQEKIDGSLAIMYYYDNKWHVATSGTPDASGNVYGFPFTFKELFWKVFHETDMKLPNTTQYTFMFELTTPYNKIVVPHSVSKITLLGIREINSHYGYVELDVAHSVVHNYFCKPDIWNWPVVKTFPLQTLGEILATLDSMPPLEQEGYVVCDKDFNRVKIKSPGYVALHHLRDSVTSPRRILELVLLGETTEIVNAFPEFKELFDNTSIAIYKLEKELLDSYQLIKNIEIQKDFAIQAVKTNLPDCLFSLRKGYLKSILDYLKNMRSQNLLELLRRVYPELMKTSLPSNF